MKTRSLLKYVVIVCAICSLFAFALRAGARPAEGGGGPGALGTAFTYQGQLQDNGAPASGSYDFRFMVYDAVNSSAPLTGTTPQTLTAVPVAQGQFTVQLDFGNIFGNQQLYLEIAVRPGNSGDAFTTLTPRQAITPVPYARYAIQAGSAATAQSVPWNGVSNKPAQLAWRNLYVPAAAMNYTPGGDLTMSEKGLRWPNTSQLGGFGIPQPDDWDKTTPFTVTLYFALYTTTEPGVARWRLHTGGSEINLSPDYPDPGWDQMHYATEEDATLLNYGHAAGRSYMMKSQSWVPKWSATYHAWYFGADVTTSNDFGNNPMWFFYFERGIAAGNGETYDNAMYVVGAEVTYQAVP